MLAKVDNASTEAVCKGFARKFKAVPAAMRRSMTYDRGKEMAAHESLSAKLDLRIFCRPAQLMAARQQRA